MGLQGPHKSDILVELAPPLGEAKREAAQMLPESQNREPYPYKLKQELQGHPR